MAELEYQVKMEDTNYDAKIFGWRTRVRMNEKVNKVMMQSVSEGSSEDPRRLKNPCSKN